MNSDGNQPPSSPAPAAVGSSPNSRGSRATPSSTRPSSQPVVAATPPSSARRGILSSPNVASDNLGLPSSSQGDNLAGINASSPRTSDARMASQRTRSSDGGFNAADSAPATPSSQRSRGNRNDLRAGHRVNRPLDYSGRQPEESDGQGEKFIWGTTVNVKKVRDRIRDFFSNTTSRQQGASVSIRDKYERLIEEALESQESVNLDCKDLMVVDQHLYGQLVLYPVEVIECFDVEASDIAKAIVVRTGGNLDYMQEVASNIRVRPFNLRRLHVMRDLNPGDIDQLVSFRGMVIRAAPIIPDLQMAFFECNVCKYTVQVELDKGRITEPSQCANCRTQQSMIIIHNRCSFNDRQLVKCQESPGDIPQGETPHTVNLCAFDELVDKAKPGDRVQITGIYRAVPTRLRATQRSLRSVYKTYIDVIHYKKTEQGRLTTEEDGDGVADADNMRESTETATLSRERQEEMRGIAASDDVVALLTRSFAPSIVEMDDVKLGLLCQLFGGSNKNYADAAMGKFRGELNVLLIGDPGTSKSQLLQYVHKVAPRGIYTSGKGSSAVGLTAYITRDPDTKEVVLDSGALVLSDRGICCIDEFDKMSENARSVLHEVMEQQTISIAKSGIICTLNARTSILAAANPVQSKYNPRLSVVENLNLPPSLLSRFDLVYLILDRVDPISDRRLALHIVSMFYSASDAVAKSNSERVLTPAELADYISFARQTTTPELTDAAADKLVQGYMEMRSAGISSKVIAATPRQLESLIRLAESHAKMRLSTEVDEYDVDRAIWLMRVSTQKSATDPRTGQIDMDALSTGTTASSRARAHDIVRNVRSFLQTQTRSNVSLREVLDMLRTTMPQDNISDSDVRTAFSELASEGFLSRVNQDNRNNEAVRVIQNQGFRGAGDDE